MPVRNVSLFLKHLLNLLLTVTALLVSSNITAHLILSSVVKAILVIFVYLRPNLDIARSILAMVLKIEHDKFDNCIDDT